MLSRAFVREVYLKEYGLNRVVDKDHYIAWLEDVAFKSESEITTSNIEYKSTTPQSCENCKSATESWCANPNNCVCNSLFEPKDA